MAGFCRFQAMPRGLGGEQSQRAGLFDGHFHKLSIRGIILDIHDGAGCSIDVIERRGLALVQLFLRLLRIFSRRRER